MNINCSLPSYESPPPGTLEVRLASISHQIPHSSLNNFTLKVNQVQAVRSDGAKLTIYQDIRAIERKVSEFNTLDIDAQDSLLVLGQVVAPPGDYTGINMVIEPGKLVIIDAYRKIDVEVPDSLSTALQFSNPFTIPEGGKTEIVLTIDLDKSLIKGAEVYHFRPHYYVSSVFH